MELKNKEEVLSVGLSVVGIQFDNPNVIKLIIDVYDKILESEGAVTVDELIEMRDKFIKENPPNEPSGPKPDRSKK